MQGSKPPTVSIQAVHDVLPANAAGYTVDEADVTYWGICPACQTTTRDQSTEVA